MILSLSRYFCSPAKEFIRLVSYMILGFFLFDDAPEFFTIFGGLIVFGSIIYIARRERKEGKERMLVEGIPE